jgi:hypothetical protein
MNMEPLSLRLIGWVFVLVPGIALAIGALILIALYRSDGLARRYAEQSVWNDLALLSVWSAGLLGGIGVLQGQSWARPLLEFFCWVLSALVLLSGATRMHALHRDLGIKGSGNWIRAISAFLVLAIPILALCAATIFTLRSDVARLALGGH